MSVHIDKVIIVTEMPHCSLLSLHFVYMYYQLHHSPTKEPNWVLIVRPLVHPGIRTQCICNCAITFSTSRVGLSVNCVLIGHCFH